MKFQLKPILSEMKEFYSMPISSERFENYLSKLQGNTRGDLALPIPGYNPMAKEHIIGKIEELQALNAESIMEETIAEFNVNSDESQGQDILVVLNLADDSNGGWTHRSTTDFESKFKLNALVTRHFCTPYYWSSEPYTEQLIRLRTIEYMSRTMYWVNNSKLKTLEDHLEQEISVLRNTIDLNSLDTMTIPDDTHIKLIEDYYNKNKYSEQYDLIFNFFYSDVASNTLGYQHYGIKENAAYQFALQTLSKIRSKDKQSPKQ